MKHLYVAIGLAGVICLLLGLAILLLHRAAAAQEMERAVIVLADCYRFVFSNRMDQAVLDTPAAMPAALNGVAGWNDHVSAADPVFRSLYGKIDWHPPQSPAEGEEIASIDFPSYRAVVLQGGSAFSAKK